ncbi:unnamed protein product [Calicophoron daubneyi]|uniref:non-specific serine/threonine protein kinase n=1 Tax=Calicophoron daubneyi TaxID=300641 RepID=A0AAV2TV12_CALDB
MCSTENLPLNELEKQLIDPNSDFYLENILDVITSLVADCNYPSASNSRTVQSFLKRYRRVAELIEARRTKYVDFELIKVIGQGGFGRVELVRHKRTRRVYAMKMMSKQHLLDHSQSGYWEERDVMVHASSEWLVACHHAFLDKDNVYLCMEYMPGGDLYYWLEKYDTFNETQVRFYLAETVLALEALHNLRFIHRDLKPDNMLLDARGHLKLADFGSCVQADAEGYHYCSSPIGTPDYISPEMLNCQSKAGKIGPECDWWALGIIAYEMLFGEPAFYGQSLVETYSRILSHEKSLKIPTDADPISKEVESLIRAFLKPAATRLGSLAGVRAEDPSLKDASAAVVAATAQVKAHPFFASVVWHQLRSQDAPIQPVVNSETDTSNINFDERDLSSDSGLGKLPQSSGAFAPKKLPAPAYFTGNNLSFAGYTFNRDHVYLRNMNGLNENGVNSLSANQKEKAETQAKLTAFESQVNELKTIIQSLEKQNARDQVSIEDGQKRLEKSVTELNQIKQTKTEMEKTLADITNKLGASQSERDRLLADVNKIQKQYETAVENLEAERKKLCSIQDEKTNLSSEIGELKQQLYDQQVEMANRLKAKEVARNVASSESKRTEKHEAEQRELIASYESRIGDLLAENQEARQKATVLVNEATNLRRNFSEQIAELTDQLQTAQHFCHFYETQCLESKVAIEDLERRLECAENELSALRANLEGAINSRRATEDLLVAQKSALAVARVEQRSLQEQAENAQRQANSEISRLSTLADQRLAELNDVSKQLDEMRNHCAEEEHNNRMLTEQICKLQKDSEQRKQNIDVVVDKLYREVEGRLNPAAGRMRAKKHNNAAYQQLEKSYKNLEAKKKQQSEDFSRTIEQYKRDLAERNSMITSLTEELQVKDKDIDRLNSLVHQLYARLDQTNPSHSTPVRKNGSSLSPAAGDQGGEGLTVSTPSSGQRSPIGSVKDLAVGNEVTDVKLNEFFSTVLEDVVDVDGKGRGRNKLTWLPKYAVLKAFVLAFYVSRGDKELGAGPVEEIPLCQVMHVREATELDLIHAKKEDVIRTIQVFYHQEDTPTCNANGDTLSVDPNTSMVSVRTVSSGSGSNQTDIRWLDHVFHPMRFRSNTLCDYCNRPCSDILSPPPALQCIKCRMCVHLEHVDKHQKFASCVKSAQVRYLRMPSKEKKVQWIQHLLDLCKRLRELQQNPEKLLKSGLSSLASAAGGVANIGTTSAAKPLYRSMRAGSIGPAMLSSASSIWTRAEHRSHFQSSFKHRNSRHAQPSGAKSPNRSASPNSPTSPL